MRMYFVYALSIRQANKRMRMAATAYNLKKLLKYNLGRGKSGAGALRPLMLSIKETIKRPSNTFANPSI